MLVNGVSIPRAWAIAIAIAVLPDTEHETVQLEEQTGPVHNTASDVKTSEETSINRVSGCLVEV